VIRSILRLFVLVCAVALVVPAALAVDGVVLINQNTSINGLPGCPHAGFPIQICQPGSYRLSGNLAVPANMAGIEINADKVTLDLNGFSITGPGTCLPSAESVECTTDGGYAGVYVSFQNQVTIRNGSVSGMTFGIYASGQGLTIEEIHARHNRFHGISLGSDTSIKAAVLRRNTAIQNGQNGIDAWNAVVTENVVTTNGAHGLYVKNAQVSHNVSTYNKGTGISAATSTVLENTMNFNRAYGLSVERVLYGSNMMTGNTQGAVSDDDVPAWGNSTSQNNNNCHGSTC
jgi:hypothetical protein